MEQCTRSRTVRKAQSVSSPEIAELLGPDPLTEALRGMIRDVLATLFDTVRPGCGASTAGSTWAKSQNRSCKDAA